MRSYPYYYVLDDAGQPKAVPYTFEWARWFEANTDRRQVAMDDIEGVTVSTVFLGIDHSWGDGPPLLFETLIFEGDHDGHMWRYSTRAEAEAGHARVVEALRAGQDPDPEDGA